MATDLLTRIMPKTPEAASGARRTVYHFAMSYGTPPLRVGVTLSAKGATKAAENAYLGAP